MIKAYDVIVAGAGPTGAMAALHAARNGANTLLLERRTTPGIPVQCGEFMPALDELERMFPRCTELSELCEFIPACTNNSTQAINILSPGMRSRSIPFNGLVIQRGKLEQELVRQAVQAGATFLNRTAVKSCKADVLSTTAGSFKGNAIIGADGPRSIIAREAGAAPLPNMAFGAQYLVRARGLPEDEMQLYFGPIAKGGYAWVIPKGKGLFNVGVGVRRKGPPAAVTTEVLHPFLNALKQRAELKPIHFTAGLIPVGGPMKKNRVGNTILAGDAAGQVMACNGGGLPTALICGRAAGQAAAKIALGKSYDQPRHSPVGSELANGLTTRRIFDLITRSSIATEAAMKLAGTSGMRRLIMGRSWLTAALP